MCGYVIPPRPRTRHVSAHYQAITGQLPQGALSQVAESSQVASLSDDLCHADPMPPAAWEVGRVTEGSSHSVEMACVRCSLQSGVQAGEWRT